MTDQRLVDNPYPSLRAGSGNLKLMMYFVVMMLVTTQKEMSIYYITEAAREPNCKKQKHEDDYDTKEDQNPLHRLHHPLA